METPRKPSWFSRNWKWLVPGGCLSALVVFGAFLALILSIVFGSMKASDPYRQAMDRATASPAVTQALGTPIKAGFFVSGNVSVDGATGSADLAIPLSGPKGKGTLYVEARKAVGEWTFTRLEFETGAAKTRVDLLEERAESMTDTGISGSHGEVPGDALLEALRGLGDGLPAPGTVGPLGAVDARGVLHLADAVPAARVCEAFGWLHPFAVSTDVHQHGWRLLVWSADLADPWSRRIAVEPPRIAGRSVEVWLEDRPEGPLPAVVAGASPAYDLEVYAAHVVSIGPERTGS